MPMGSASTTASVSVPALAASGSVPAMAAPTAMCFSEILHVMSVKVGVGGRDGDGAFINGSGGRGARAGHRVVCYADLEVAEGYGALNVHQASLGNRDLARVLANGDHATRVAVCQQLEVGLASVGLGGCNMAAHVAAWPVTRMDGT